MLIDMQCDFIGVNPVTDKCDIVSFKFSLIT